MFTNPTNQSPTFQRAPRRINLDITYRLVSVPRHSGSMAERLGVLKALCPKLDLTSDVEVWKAAKTVQGMWRRRLICLEELGWEPACGKRGQYLRNCPPAAVDARPLSGTAVRFCRLGTVCPWCWARRVIKRTWDAVIEAMTRLDCMYERGRTEYPFKLVFFKTQKRIGDNKDQPALLLSHIDMLLRRSRRRWTSQCEAFASIGVIHPVNKKWAYSVRALALVPSDDQMPPEYKVVDKPLRRNIASVVGRFARFPTGNLFGDPEKMLRLLALRSGYRLLRLSGAFRGKHD